MSSSVMPIAWNMDRCGALSGPSDTAQLRCFRPWSIISVFLFQLPHALLNLIKGKQSGHRAPAKQLAGHFEKRSVVGRRDSVFLAEPHDLAVEMLDFRCLAVQHHVLPGRRIGAPFGR